MSKYVSDTMALILHLENRKMPDRAKDIFNSAEKGGAEIFIPGMVIAEIGYLSEKGRIETTVDDIKQTIYANQNFKEKPLDLIDIQSAFSIDDIPELHDRLIAGTAKAMGIEIISNDPVIEKSAHVRTVWR